MDRFEILRQRLARDCPALEVRVGEPMSRHTSFHIGGPAALMALPKTREEAQAALAAAGALGIEPFFLGNGSNLLVPDGGAERFFIKTAGLNWCRWGEGWMEAGAGLTLARLAVCARDQGLTGLEFAHGIPGSVGGGVTMNAGAYGGEMAQVLERVTVLEPGGAARTIPASECGLGYRKSAFSDGHALIVEARFRLASGDPAAIQGRMEELARQRQAKQPLEYPSAGSMFKRPPGHFAGALIDQCGLRGLTVGGAQVSEKHAGFVINRGGATCADVLSLVEQVRERVLRQTGVELEMEVRVVR